MNILVSGITRNLGAAIANGLRDAGHRVVGIDVRELPGKARICAVDTHYFLPGEQPELRLERIKNIIAREKIDVFIPTIGTGFASKFKAELSEACRLLAPSYEAFKAAYCKITSAKLCRQAGIKTPRIYTLQDAKDHFKAGIVSPLIVKPAFDIGGSRALAKVKTIEELIAAYDYASEYGEVLIQQYIPGDSRCMRTVNVIYSPHHTLAAYFTTQKIRQWPESGGVTAMSVSTHEQALLELAERFFQQLPWTGPAEIECKLDPCTKELYLIEVNPRYSGYSGFAIACGLNLADIQARLAMGECIEADADQPAYRLEQKYWNASAYCKSVLSALRTKPNRLTQTKYIFSELRHRKLGNNSKKRDWPWHLSKFIYQLKHQETPAETWH